MVTYLRQDEVGRTRRVEEILGDDVLGFPHRDHEVAPDGAKVLLQVQHALQLEPRAVTPSLG